MKNKELEKKFKNIEAWLEVFACKLGYDYKKISKEFDDAENITILAGEKPHHEFKVGDRVQFKSWEEMEKEFLIDNIGDVHMRDTTFVLEMRHLCGTYATIAGINQNLVKLKDFTADGDTRWTYSLDMLKPATNEPKCKFKVGDKVKDIKTGKICTVKKTDNAFFDCMIECSADDFIIWRNSERDLLPYTEPRWNFTDDEKVILKNLPEEYKWIVRDKSDDLIVFLAKPEKCEDMWHLQGIENHDYIYEFNHLFQSIKWSDDQACEFRKYL